MPYRVTTSKQLPIRFEYQRVRSPCFGDELLPVGEREELAVESDSNDSELARDLLETEM
jgi:hypothetical protein